MHRKQDDSHFGRGQRPRPDSSFEKAPPPSYEVAMTQRGEVDDVEKVPPTLSLESAPAPPCTPVEELPVPMPLPDRATPATETTKSQSRKSGCPSSKGRSSKSWGPPMRSACGSSKRSECHSSPRSAKHSSQPQNTPFGDLLQSLSVAGDEVKRNFGNAAMEVRGELVAARVETQRELTIARAEVRRSLSEAAGEVRAGLDEARKDVRRGWGAKRDVWASVPMAGSTRR